ncbi:phospho-sugar mutase [Ureaplasma parvum]|uniref:phospho-sugar mutase n=1 Tax=Ureaplasma parvum TaxID=134821 RepID=UPI00114F6D87|nr:phospho-sugar mutase [Ureaplasma parvum]QDI64497.1 phospho-sugar mutase [Ureaplasma parvum]UIU28481.1 phospho-sugar mutase [Ureaplasma parvum]
MENTNKIFNCWLNSPKIPQVIKEEYKNKTQKEIDHIFDENYRFKFGTSGVRCIYEEGTRYLNAITYTQLTLGFIKYLETKKNFNKIIVIGRDNRFGSRENLKLVAEIFSSFDYTVYINEDYGMLSTPITSFLINQLQAGAGIMITASHNPKNYNGFKVYNANGAQPLVDDTNLIESLMPSYIEALDFNFEFKQDNIRFLTKEQIQGYFDAVKAQLINTDPNIKKPFKIVFSGHHGTTTKDMIPFLESLGYDMVSVSEQNFEDPNFNDDPSSNPEEQCSFDLSVEYADNTNAEIMIASDPDGDRMAIAVRHENYWKFLTGNQTGVLIAHYLLEHKKFTKPTYIISTFISTRYPELFAKNFDCDVLYVDVGFKNHGNLIANRKKTHDLVVGFEEAIGSLPSDINNDKDSYQTASILLEMINYYYEQKLDLFTVLKKEIFAKYGNWYSKTAQFVIDGDNWKQKALIILNNLRNFEFKTVTQYTIHNIIFHEQGSYLEWKLDEYSTIKFRLSGTEPKFKVYIDLYDFSKDQKRDFYQELKIKAEDILDFLKNYLGL